MLLFIVATKFDLDVCPPFFFIYFILCHDIEKLCHNTKFSMKFRLRQFFVATEQKFVTKGICLCSS